VEIEKHFSLASTTKEMNRRSQHGHDESLIKKQSLESGQVYNCFHLHADKRTREVSEAKKMIFFAINLRFPPPEWERARVKRVIAPHQASSSDSVSFMHCRRKKDSDMLPTLLSPRIWVEA
jgi:hypothetical protein